MANNLNITLANFIEDTDLAFIGEIKVYIKEPQAAGDSSTDTVTVRPLGIMNDEKPLKIKKEFAKLERGIPRQTLRKDVIRETITLEGTLNQIQKETLALVLNRKIDTATGTAWNRILLGSKIPQNNYWSIILEGTLNTGDNIAIFLRKVQFTAEDVEVMFGSEEYAGIAFVVECLPDPNPLSNNPDWDFKDTVTFASCGTTSGDKTVTISDTTGLYVDMRIVGAGIPAGAYVTAITEDTSFEISENATASATVTLKGENMQSETAEDEDVGFIAFERPAA